MWFYHHRLKDRTKRQQREDEPLPMLPRKNNDRLNSFYVVHDSKGKHKKPMFKTALVDFRIEGNSFAIGKHYYNPEVLLLHPLPELTMAEKWRLASVESQLGEPVRQDGPLLGDKPASMPPSAFGAPIEMPMQQKQPICSYDVKFERFDTKSLKVYFLSLLQLKFITICWPYDMSYDM
ncbi:hypothetical protein ZIOFF_065151 [Zingiber officinale]|uniref:Uncharacterized protein n=1 Tax=Zingiber officinale TaxID=94328 RepID=A0A8J5KBB0_ZINOF|nr:hypothetical protein ZIOFF_065151 [Zingiber officinale]